MNSQSFPNLRNKVSMLKLMVPVVCALLFSTASVDADLAEGNQFVPTIAEQMVRIAPGSPFGNNDELIFEVSAQGFIDISWGDENSGVAPVTNFFAAFTGTNSLLGNFDLVGGTLATTQPASFGDLSNITDNNGDLVSADLTIDTGFNLLFAGGNIYTQDTVIFEGQINGSPFKDVYTSDDPVDLYLSLGGDPANDPVIGQSFNRIVRAVPEPSGLGLLACFAMLGFKRRRAAN